MENLSEHKSGTSIEKYFSSDGLYKVISIGSYGLNNEYIDQGIRAVKNKTTESKLVRSGQLTMVLNDKTANGNLIGRCLLISTDNEFIVNQRTEIIIPGPDLNGNYAYYYLNGPFRSKVKRIAQGGTQIYVNYSSVKKQKINYPIKDEQIKISKLLKIIKKLITLYAKKSSCLDSCIAYFIRILYDDPQFFKQKNVQNSIIKSFKLDDILIKNNAKNKNLSILNVESISNKKGFISQKEQFDNYQVASKDLSNYYVIHPKDFAYNPSRINVGSIAYKSPNDVKGIVSPLYVSFKCKNDIVLDKYLWHWFKSTNFEHQRVRLSEGGVRDTLSFNQLSKMKISIPSFEIQRQTINLLEILIQYKEEVDLKLNNLKLIKNTLLQNMFL